MPDGEWHMPDGKWQMANDKWRMAEDTCEVTSGGWGDGESGEPTPGVKQNFPSSCSTFFWRQTTGVSSPARAG